MIKNAVVGLLIIALVVLSTGNVNGQTPYPTMGSIDSTDTPCDVDSQCPIDQKCILPSLNCPAGDVCPVPSRVCRATLVGDSNYDGKVDLVDFDIWKRESTGRLTTKLADFDKNGIVNLQDFPIWKNIYLAK